MATTRGMRFVPLAAVVIVVAVAGAAIWFGPAAGALGTRGGSPSASASTPASTPTVPSTPTTEPTQPPLAACAYGSQPARHAGPDDWQSTLVDTTFGLDPTYVPPDLVPVSRSGIKGQGLVRSLVIADLQAMNHASRLDGAGIAVNSAYRSYKDQTTVFDGVAQASGSPYAQKWVASPGHSEHQLGTALDFNGNLDWLQKNAWKFGFIMSYPPAVSPRLTCYQPETWHFRYFGVALAAQIHASGLTTREWLWKNAW